MGLRGGAGGPFGRDPAALLAAALGLGAEPSHPSGAAEETDFPAVDIFETAAEVVVEVELPGVDPARVTVTLEGGALVVEGTKEEDAAPRGRVAYLCMERSFGPFRRVVPLLGAVDLGRASARCRAGVLRIRLPKLEEKRGRRRVIPVAVEPGP